MSSTEQSETVHSAGIVAPTIQQEPQATDPASAVRTSDRGVRRIHLVRVFVARTARTGWSRQDGLVQERLTVTGPRDH